jgi:hypothetical protein
VESVSVLFSLAMVEFVKYLFQVTSSSVFNNRKLYLYVNFWFVVEDGVPKKVAKKLICAMRN